MNKEQFIKLAVQSGYGKEETAREYTEANDKQSWAEQAKMRANKTASTYNNYILENSYIWSGNVPADIATELEYIE